MKNGNRIALAGAFIAIVTTAVLCTAVFKEWQRIANVEEAATRITNAGLLSDATIELSLERSLSQVALALDEPIARNIREMIDRQRQVSNQGFADARERLVNSTRIQERSELIASLDRKLQDLENLRKSVDQAVALALPDRDPLLVKQLPTRLKQRVEEISQVADILRLGIGEVPQVITSLDMLVQKAWSIREYGGRERTYFAIATARSEPIARDDLMYMIYNHGRAEHAFQHLAMVVQDQSIPDTVRLRVEELKELYFEDYDRLRQQLLAASTSGDYQQDFASVFEQSEAALQKAIELSRVSLAANLEQVDLMVWSAWSFLILELVVIAIGGVILVFVIKSVRANKTAIENESLEKAERNAKIEQRIADFDQAARQLLEDLNEAGKSMHRTAKDMGEAIGLSVREVGQAQLATKKTAQSVSSVASASQEMNQNFSSIIEQMGKSDSMVRSVGASGADAERHAQALQDKTQSIGRIVGLINEIAEQTNLLALNATIEAARAGDAGRGFAVVASEVKSLANQTATATREIEAEIAGISEVSQEVADGMTRIANAIEELGSVSAEISARMEEQAVTTQDIVHKTTDVVETTNVVVSQMTVIETQSHANGNASEAVLERSTRVQERSDKLGHLLEAFLSDIRAA